jgi:hypothetical protein
MGVFRLGGYMTEEIMYSWTSGEIDPASILAGVQSDRKMLNAVFLGLSSSLPRVKFGCSKLLVLLSEADPEILYDKIDAVIELLKSENQILKWNAISILGNMARIDRDDRIKGLLPYLYKLLSSGELVTTNHAIAALGKIARNFPDKQKTAVSKLLAIEHGQFETGECKNIAIGKVVLALQMFIDPTHAGKAVLSFVERQTKNRRPATASKARSFLRKITG